MPLEHLDIPEEILNLRSDLRERRQTRYQHLMEQHRKMKKEESFRLVRDALVIFGLLAAGLTLLGIIFHHEEED